MNICVFVGRFVDDPVLTQVNNTQVVQFSLILEEYRRDKDGNKKKRVDYLNFEVWDSGAKVIHEFCRIGDMITVESKAHVNNKDEVYFRVESFKLFNAKD